MVSGKNRNHIEHCVRNRIAFDKQKRFMYNSNNPYKHPQNVEREREEAKANILI